MRSLLILILAMSFLYGCASQPRTPEKKADAAGAMGMIMMASAAQQKGSTASALWQVRFPPSAIEVITIIQSHRRSSGTWPKKEDIPLPADLTELELHEAEQDLSVVLKKGNAVAARFTILRDGTVVASPLVDDVISALQSQPGSGLPVVPILVAPKE